MPTDSTLNNAELLSGSYLPSKSAENNPSETPDKPTANPAGSINLDNLGQCATQTCSNGHIWTPQLGLPGCQACRSPIVALRMVNCPICNEPVVRTRLRIDHIGGSHPITKTCQREYHIGPEYTFVEIDHTHNTWITEGKVPTAASPKTINRGVARLAQTPNPGSTVDSNS